MSFFFFSFEITWAFKAYLEMTTTYLHSFIKILTLKHLDTQKFIFSLSKTFYFDDKLFRSSFL